MVKIRIQPINLQKFLNHVKYKKPFRRGKNLPHFGMSTTKQAKSFLHVKLNYGVLL